MSERSGILEIRKERSRDAARSRRGKENFEFYELAKMLPLPGAITGQLDKASIIRLTISYLKLRDFSSHGDPPWSRDGPPPNKTIAKGNQGRRRSMTAVAMEIFETSQGSHILQSLDGFGFSLTNDGRFLYISETVSIYLGLSQVEMTGSSIFDYIHQQDHSELSDQFGLNPPQGTPSGGSTSDDSSSTAGTPTITSPLHERAGIMTPNLSKGFDRSFSIRMKSTLTKRGVHVKTSGYRVVHILAHMRPQFSFSVNRKHPPHLIGIVGIALALPPPTISELRMENDTFVTRLGLDFTISYCEPKVSELMNISPDDLNNRSLYDFIHAEDLKRIRKSHVDLLSKGQVLTDYYRMLNKHGGYVWVQTCAMMILNKNDDVISTIIGVNTVLSGIEYSNCIMDTSQMKTVFRPDPDQSDHSENDSGSDQDPGKNGEKDTPSLEPSVVPHGTVASSSANRNGSRQASTTGKSHSSSHETQSPEAALEKISNTKEVDILSEDVFFEDSNKMDTRISRRKLDKPRKRKRSLADEIQSHLDKYSGTVQNNTRLDDENGAQETEQMQKPDNDSSASEQYHMSSVASDMDQSPPAEVAAHIQSPIPEDLTLRPRSNPLQSPPLQPNTPGSVATNSTKSSENFKSTQQTLQSPFSDQDENGGNAVRDLEKAMNKHLPTEGDGFHNDMSSITQSGALPSKQQQQQQQQQQQVKLQQQQQKSTIQWIGSQPSGVASNLPASSLLRHIYANRESVIRPNIYTPRPPFYGDNVLQGATMLTPPGEGAYKEQPSFSLVPFPASSVQVPTSYGLMANYTNNHPLPPGGLPDYNITPPSSVSPQEKYQSPFPDPTLLAQHYFVDGGQQMKGQANATPAPAHTGTRYDSMALTAQYQTGFYAHHGAYAATTSFGGSDLRDKQNSDQWS